MDKLHKEKNWRLCMREGVCSAVMTGITQDYFTPFILFLGAGVRQVGLLIALPNLFSAIAQVNSPNIVTFFHSRKRAVTIAMLSQAVILALVIFLTFFKLINIWFFIIAVIAFTCFGAVISGVYASMLVDFIIKDKQGEYLGLRNWVVGFVMIASSLVAGTFLYYSKSYGALYGFAVLFLAAFLFRMVSFYFFSKIEEKSIVVTAQDNFTLRQFFARLHESNFAKFVVFVSLMQFASNLASPFFAVHMLKDLNFNYITYTIVTVASTITIYFMMHRWGKHADIVGNIKVIRFVAPFIGVVPLLWLLDRHPLYLIFAQFFSGFVWSGFMLCTANFIYDAVSEGKRTRCIAYFNFCSGIAVCLGALTGGFILNYLPQIFGYKFLTLCVISGVLRMAVGIFIPIFIQEVRPVKRVHSRELFLSVLGLRPIRAT